MKAATLVIGIAAGMAMATAGDSRRALRCGKRAVGQIGNLFG